MELKEILQPDCSPNTEVTAAVVSLAKSSSATNLIEPSSTFSSSDVRVGTHRVLKEEKKEEEKISSSKKWIDRLRRCLATEYLKPSCLWSPTRTVRILFNNYGDVRWGWVSFVLTGYEREEKRQLTNDDNSELFALRWLTSYYISQ